MRAKVLNQSAYLSDTIFYRPRCAQQCQSIKCFSLYRSEKVVHATTGTGKVESAGDRFQAHSVCSSRSVLQILFPIRDCAGKRIKIRPPLAEREPVTFRFPDQITRSTRRQGRRRKVSKQTATFKNLKTRLRAGGISAVSTTDARLSR